MYVGMIGQVSLDSDARSSAVCDALLLSDTLPLTSPPTTDRDQRATDRLSRWSLIGASLLASETRESFGQQPLPVVLALLEG
jgi:hypothetical protein